MKTHNICLQHVQEHTTQTVRVCPIYHDRYTRRTGYELTIKSVSRTQVLVPVAEVIKLLVNKKLLV